MSAIVQRAQAHWGDYGFWEYETFCTDCGLEILRWPDEKWPKRQRRAYLLGNKLVIRAGLPRMVEARTAWHEIGHVFTCCGNREFWRTRPQGHITLAKMEKRATDFGMRFPHREGS